VPSDDRDTSGATGRCSVCGTALDAARHARCDVCRGALFCITCAKAHLCTARCRTNGCIAGLCVHVVRDGVTDARYGVHE
jgi:hypothetical protein